mmetsp:Transcript_44741/g.101224  ORF Transcript_44741/g.101224 Transcript_44741/m.101224 type:complete len:220 (+) Transcript_44741:1790-2449(+)
MSGRWGWDTGTGAGSGGASGNRAGGVNLVGSTVARSSWRSRSGGATSEPGPSQGAAACGRRGAAAPGSMEFRGDTADRGFKSGTSGTMGGTTITEVTVISGICPSITWTTYFPFGSPPALAWSIMSTARSVADAVPLRTASASHGRACATSSRSRYPRATSSHTSAASACGSAKVENHCQDVAGSPSASTEWISASKRHIVVFSGSILRTSEQNLRLTV